MANLRHTVSLLMLLSMPNGIISVKKCFRMAPEPKKDPTFTTPTTKEPLYVDPRDPDFKGVRHNLTCYNRGDSADGNPDFLVLCAKCYVMRVLPTGYFPPFVNEVVCSGDKNCLNFYGTCSETFKTFKVLTNYDPNCSTKPTELTIGISTGCECTAKFNGPKVLFINMTIP